MITYNGNILKVGGSWLNSGSSPAPSLPSYTIRLLYTDGSTPSFSKGTGVQVSQSPNVWDLTYESDNWANLLNHHIDLLEVVEIGDTSGVVNTTGMFQDCFSLSSVPIFDTSNVTEMNSMFSGTAITSAPLFNTSKVTSMNSMFYRCQSLVDVPLFDTSKVTDMYTMFSYCSVLTGVPLFDTSSASNIAGMFSYCTRLTSVPLFDTQRVTRMFEMFYNCSDVESGALALYQQASGQSNPPTNYTSCFKYCGINTVTGIAELQQIPTSWGGLLADNEGLEGN